MISNQIPIPYFFCYQSLSLSSIKQSADGHQRGTASQRSGDQGVRVGHGVQRFNATSEEDQVQAKGQGKPFFFLACVLTMAFVDEGLEFNGPVCICNSFNLRHASCVTPRPSRWTTTSWRRLAARRSRWRPRRRRPRVGRRRLRTK